MDCQRGAIGGIKTKTIAKAVDCATVLTASEAKAMKAAGYDAVCRYLGPWQKCLTLDEVPAIVGTGLKIVSIWEGDPTSASYFTASQAKSDVAEAIKVAESLGQPAGTPIYFTVDYDAASKDMAAIEAYFKIIMSGIGVYRPGVYGGEPVLLVLYQTYGAKLDYWQTTAWSDGETFAHAAMLQDKYELSIAGVQCDTSEVYSDPGWWPAEGEQNMTYPKVTAKLNGRIVSAVDVDGVTYLIWTVARDLKLNVTKAVQGDVEIAGKKPPQVVGSDGNTYINWDAFGGLTANKLSGGGFNFTTKAADPAPASKPPQQTTTGPTPDDIAKAESLIEQADELLKG